MSGYFSLAILTASATIVTLSCLALPYEENESIATLGSAPTKLLNESADNAATSASFSESRSGLTAQSANTNNPFSPNSQLGTSIRKKPDTLLIPGLVFNN